MPYILRIILSLIYILIALFAPGRYRRGWGYSGYDRNYAYNYDLYPTIRNSVRRFFAMHKAKRYITQTANCIYLENEKVRILYNAKACTLKCYNKENQGQSFKVYAVDRRQYAYIQRQTEQEFFTENFYNLCHFFDGFSSYLGIKVFFDENFEISEEKRTKKNIKLPKKFVAAPTVDEIEKVEIKEKIDINTASESEIAALPGINVVLAKKIIKYRNLHNGFKNIDEFYGQMGIKPHFQVQLDELIKVKNVKTKKKPQDEDNDRIIDL